MKYDFDQIIDRKGTGCIKYDSASEFGKPEGLIPLWIADMDFRVAEPIVEALKKKADYGVLGYEKPSSTYFDAVSGWFSRRFGWTPKKEWLVITSGVVPAINFAIKALTSEDDGIIIQTPVYYPFTNAIIANNRRLVENPLVIKDDHYEMDLDDFEKKIVDNDVKMLIFCSPHNPVGRVWTFDELKAIGEICNEHDVIVVADEIHCDFTYGSHKHTMFIDACPELAHSLNADAEDVASFYADQILCLSAGLRLSLPKLEKLELELAPQCSVILEQSDVIFQPGVRFGAIWHFETK